MNLIQIPFHDLRKIEKEGSRTRDAHFIEAFVSNKNIDKLLVIDRPTTWLEIFLKKKSKNISSEKILLQRKGLKLVQRTEKYYAITYNSNDVLGQILEQKKWFRKAFTTPVFVNFIHESLELLNMQDAHLLSNNIFACDLVDKLRVEKKVFDAWDDFSKFGHYKSIQSFIKNCYRKYAKVCNLWTTNADGNKISFKKEYDPRKIEVVKNGVDTKRFKRNLKYDLPSDMLNIPKPFYGFGGKITDLIDPELMQKVVELNPDKSFVFVGQNLLPEILNQFRHYKNVYYLGDKHYNVYPQYVSNFDVCLVPYVDNKRSSGANTIKVYEYLALGKKVVGTLGNGLEDLTDYLYVTENAEEFSKFLDERYPNKSGGFDAEKYSWEEKTKQMIQFLN